MLKGKWRWWGGCVLTPVLLIGGCTSKMYWDDWMYQLPGPVLASTVPPTRSLQTAFQVAEALDGYVQPRFEILRDKNFGAFRIVYLQHAGIVQLKVDTPQEKEVIANVNAARRDYAISLLHCADVPGQGKPEFGIIELLYFNQHQVVQETEGVGEDEVKAAAAIPGLDEERLRKKADAQLPRLLTGKEFRTSNASWDTLMRPVTASGQRCLGCHTEAKSGDTLGVMVYSVHKTTRLTD